MVTTIHDILREIRLKATTEREKGTDFERLMKLWFQTDPRYNNLEKVWLWEEFPGRKDFGFFCNLVEKDAFQQTFQL
jgi:predicted helicase